MGRPCNFSVKGLQVGGGVKVGQYIIFGPGHQRRPVCLHRLKVLNWIKSKLNKMLK
jgi:hypothetical protein